MHNLQVNVGVHLVCFVFETNRNYLFLFASRKLIKGSFVVNSYKSLSKESAFASFRSDFG